MAKGMLYMLEIPESVMLARQLNELIKGKCVQQVVVASTPHKFAFYSGNPEKYDGLLRSKVMRQATGFGSWVEIFFEDVMVTFSEGANILYQEKGKKRPSKHQLLIEFEDGTGLTATIQMYGAIC